jgi:hypothetical protein
MDQTSNVQYRAEKIYKNFREKFCFLLREVISNSLHSIIIKQECDKIFSPNLGVIIKLTDKECDIQIIDNGEGFTSINSEYFSKLDEKNPVKEQFKFHPLGQGRLAIVYFTDGARYDTIYCDENGKYWTKSFPYPELTNSLFNVDNFTPIESETKETGTKLSLFLTKQQTLLRAKTFFAKYDTTTKIKTWIIETFFPFIVNNDRLSISLNFNGDNEIISKKDIESSIKSILFKVSFLNDDQKLMEYDFKTWLIESIEKPKTRNEVICFARNLKAEIQGGKIEYCIDLPTAYDWYLTSEFFDINVEQKGDQIELNILDIEKINNELNNALNEYFSEQIKLNKKQSQKNVNNVKKKYHSLSVFINEDEMISDNIVLNESDIVDKAIDIKGSAEKKYWSSSNNTSEETEKLLNSSLQIYIDHRARVLAKLQILIRKFDDDGVPKEELESEVHELFLKRGHDLTNTHNINHLHNLWILDDKFTIFSETMQAKSTINGQSKADVYIWMDDPKKVKEILILELKSTTNAHNAGDKSEGMVAQVRRYATSFYHDPMKVLNWNIDPDTVLYTGMIIARKADIYKELSSDSLSGNYDRIPFLESSYYYNDQFSISRGYEKPNHKPIRIEMYSFEDLYYLALNRNTVFFNLLNNEFTVATEEE